MKIRKFSARTSLVVGALVAGVFVCPVAAIAVPTTASAACSFGGGGVGVIRGGGRGGNCGADEFAHGGIANSWCDQSVNIVVAHWSVCHDQFADGTIRDCNSGGGGFGGAGGGGGTCTDPYP